MSRIFTRLAGGSICGIVGVCFESKHRDNARFPLKHSVALADNTDHLKQQPSFGATTNMKMMAQNEKVTSNVGLDKLVMISGTASRSLANELSEIIGVPLCNTSISRFADGEVSIQVLDHIRGRNVYIVQSCASPVNDSIMELLLTVSCARRAGARKVTAVIPYFGYKHHRRGSPISTKHHSRFLSSSAMDFAKMLQEMGVDRVIAVDLQRPGQGHEACFFDNNVPLETIITTDFMVNYFVKNIPLQHPIVVVAPNSESVKKARNFQLGFKKSYGKDVKLAAFMSPDTTSGPTDTNSLQLLGDVQISGADVVIVDDMVDTAGTMHNLSKKLQMAGARNVYVCASHGLFTEQSTQLIEDGFVRKVVVTNSLPLPPQVSSKVEQVSIAPLLANVIVAEHFRTISDADEEYAIDD